MIKKLVVKDADESKRRTSNNADNRQKITINIKYIIMLI